VTCHFRQKSAFALLKKKEEGPSVHRITSPLIDGFYLNQSCHQMQAPGREAVEKLHLGNQEMTIDGTLLKHQWRL
jgi:hypothetical protein